MGCDLFAPPPSIAVVSLLARALVPSRGVGVVTIGVLVTRLA